MNLELFIARKIYFRKNDEAKKFSSSAVKIATIGVAIAVIAMILSVVIVFGFKNEIRAKIVGFAGHIQIENYENHISYEKKPISINDSLMNVLKSKAYIKSIQPYITREGIIKTQDNFQGVIFKGIESDYDWSFFENYLLEGELPNANEEDYLSVLISKDISNKLKLNLNDTFFAYFFQDKIQARKLKISGIYKTNFDTYDKLYVVSKLDLLQKLNKWDTNQVSGLEIMLNNFNDLDYISDLFAREMLYGKDAKGDRLSSRTVEEINPFIFDWLALMDMNVWTIIILMFIVSGFTLSSGLLILILEQTSKIGILKALGMSNKKLMKVFLYVSSFIIIKGIIWGNVIVFAFILLQHWTGFIKLDPDTYYMAQMPMDVNIWYVLGINLGVLIVSIFMMLAPSLIISKISPSKVIKFE